MRAEEQFTAQGPNAACGNADAADGVENIFRETNIGLFYARIYIRKRLIIRNIR